MLWVPDTGQRCENWCQSVGTSLEKQTDLSFQKLLQLHTCSKVWAARKQRRRGLAPPAGQAAGSAEERGAGLTAHLEQARAPGPSPSPGPSYQPREGEAGAPEAGPPPCPQRSHPTRPAHPPLPAPPSAPLHPHLPDEVPASLLMDAEPKLASRQRQHQHQGLIRGQHP